ncbi:MAG: nucleotide pyrophosphohydrolase [Ferruginibacter sp.]
MIQEITLNDAQQSVDGWIKTTGIRYFNELTNLGILMEEVGELSRHMVRIYGDQSYRNNEENLIPGEEARVLLADEMADVLWVLLCLANQTGVNLSDEITKNFEKKSSRDANRHNENEKLK